MQQGKGLYRGTLTIVTVIAVILVMVAFTVNTRLAVAQGFELFSANLGIQATLPNTQQPANTQVPNTGTVAATVAQTENAAAALIVNPTQTATHVQPDPINLRIACVHGSTIQAAFNISNTSTTKTFSGSWTIDHPQQSGSWSLAPGAVAGTFYGDPLATMHVHVNELGDDLFAQGSCISTPTPGFTATFTVSPVKATATAAKTNTPGATKTVQPTSVAPTNTPSNPPTTLPAITNTPGTDATETIQPGTSTPSTPPSTLPAITNTPGTNATGTIQPGTSTPSNPPGTLPAVTNTPGANTTVLATSAANNNSQSCVDWMVYHTNQTGDWEIFRLGNIANMPQANINLSQGIGADDIGMSLSPDKAWIAFASNRNGNFEIYVAATDGTAQMRVTNHPNATSTDPVWSVDGTTLVYESNFGGAWDLYTINVGTKQEKRLTTGMGSSLNARFAPDGSGLIFESIVDFKSQIYHLDLTTSTLIKLSDGQGDDLNPTYSPDGSKIAFYSFRNSLKSSLYIMNADGSNVTDVSDTTMSAINPSWSPDGALIAYQAQTGVDLGVYVYELSTTKTRRVTDINSVNYAPTWYCNSTTLVFTSNVTGNPNLFSTQALPIDAQAIHVDTQGQELTSLKNAAAQFAEDSPQKENASNLGPPAPSLILPSLGGTSKLKCGDVTRIGVVGGSLDFPVIDTKACPLTNVSATP